MQLDSLNKLINEFARTAELRQYKLSGKLKAVMLRLFNADIPFEMRFTVDSNDSVRGYLKFDIPYILGVTKNKTVTEMYLEDDVVYVKRFMKRLTIFSKDKTDYVKFRSGDFSADPIGYIAHIFNLTDSIKNKISDSVTANSRGEQDGFRIENALKDYQSDGTEYYVLLDGAYITNDDNFSDISLWVRPDGSGYLRSVAAETKIISVLNIKVDASINDIGQAVDMSLIPSGLAQDAKYQWR